jgi:hypothetical protein
MGSSGERALSLAQRIDRARKAKENMENLERQHTLPAVQGGREVMGGQAVPMVRPQGGTPSPYGFGRRVVDGDTNIVPPPRVVGQQSAGEAASGPFFSTGNTNLPMLAQRPNFTRLGYQTMLADMDGQPPAGLGGGEQPPGVSVPMPEGPARDPQDVIMDQVNRERDQDDMAIFQKAAAQAKPRIAAPVRRPEPAPERPAPAPEKGLLSRIFSGEDYQSSNALASDPRLAGYNARVVQDGKVNYGDRDNAADFFRADAARMAMEKKAAEEGEGKAKGGAVVGKDAAIHKALEIIHHLLTRGH